MTDTYEFLKAQKDAIVAKQEADQGKFLQGAYEDIQYYKAQLEKVTSDRDDWKARALKSEQVGVARIVECASRLVQHADFKLGGCLSADSKAKDIPSKAVSQVKSRHLAALRDALSATPPQPAAQEPTSAATVVEQLVEALDFVSQVLTVDASGKLMFLEKRVPALIAAESALTKGQQYLQENGK